MSKVPEPVPASTGNAPVSRFDRMVNNCWSCRILSGGGLIVSAIYVYHSARKVMRQGGPTSPGTVAQITFAACLAAWGVVIITDPVGKSHRKTDI